MKNKITTVIGGLLKQIKSGDYKKLLVFSLLFVAIKFSTFIAPLLLSNLLENRLDYGLIEYVLSLGLIFATPFALGMHGAYPYFNIKLKKPGFKSVFYAHGAYVFVLVALGSIAFAFQLIALKIFMSIIVGAIFSLQMLLSSILKSHGIIKKAVIVEGGLYLILNLFNLTLWVTLGVSLDLLIGMFSVYLLILLLFFAFKYVSITNFSLNRYKESLYFGLKIVLSGFLILLLTGSTKIIVEEVLGLDEVALYGFYFRLAAPVVMIHQLINIAYFKKIYESEPKILDHYFSLFIAGLFLLSFLLWLILPLLVTNYFDILQNTYSSMKGVYFLIIFQVLFWIGLALNENIVYRENLAMAMNSRFIIIISLMLLSIYVLDLVYKIELSHIVMINTIFMYIATEVQFYILKNKKSISFQKTRFVNLFLIISFFISYPIFF